MSVTYDGKLVLNGKTIEPCCHSMQLCIFTGLIYVGSQAKAPTIALRTGDKKGIRIVRCPFCGAQAEVKG